MLTADTLPGEPQVIPYFPLNNSLSVKIEMSSLWIQSPAKQLFVWQGSGGSLTQTFACLEVQTGFCKGLGEFRC